MDRLKDKVCLITGAASGFGREMTLLFAKEGAKVIAADYNEKILDMYRPEDGDITPVVCDVTNHEQVINTVNLARTKFGRLDVLCNNAGINNKKPYRTHEYPVEEWDQLYNVLVRGAFLVLRESLQLMLESGGGSVINTGSIGAFRATVGSTAYCSAKGAIRMMTTNAAAEYVKDNIRINSVCPGIFNTAILDGLQPDVLDALAAQVPMGKIGEPIDMAYLALFLASDESKYITGQNWLIDGGRSCM
ncbi:MAG: SDR family oxidoreductase [Bacilli bacterium]|nr:SDR family oxidoreductase [Bacilli bacterium]